MPLLTTPVDLADYLRDDEARADFLNDAIETGDAKYLSNALGIIARSRNIHGSNDMSNLADEIGVARSGLYKALSDKGNPRLSTFLNLIKALNMKIEFKAA
jgi:probable addiction module antidote protein